MLKLKIVWNDAVLVLLGIALGALLTLALVLPMPREIQNNAAANHATKEGDNKPQWGWVFDLIVAGGTGVIAIYAVFQYVESRKSSERQLRAYINVKGGGRTGDEVFLTVENFGQTPAHDVSFWIMAVMRNGDDIPPFSKPDWKEFSGAHVVAPRGKFIIRHDIGDFRKQSANVTGKPIPGAVYAFGEIVYTDVFQSEPRTTLFRYFKPERDGDGALMVYDDGNTAT